MNRITRTIREQITDRIRDQVVAGELEPGQTLREVEFAERFGVSRGPVRDAFLSLAQEGLLDYQPNRGVTVGHPPTPEHRALITSLRQQIECFVARRGLKRLDGRGLARIERSLRDLQAACDTDDEASIARCDLAFHEAILVGCGGADFLPIWKWLCSQMLMNYGRLDDSDAIYREHEAIFEAVRLRRVTAIRSPLKANIR